MRRSLLLLSVLIALLVLGACNSEPAKAPEPAATDAPAATPDASADPLTGTWKGDWGPSASDRNQVTVDLKLDGTAVTGTVNQGPNAIPLKGSFNKDTSTVTMEADAKGHGGEAIHYTIEGKVDGTTMSGSWNQPKNKGDFKITKS